MPMQHVQLLPNIYTPTFSHPNNIFIIKILVNINEDKKSILY
ncbi:hypothetical protein OKW21_003207 [Catalinimonas alkaloidigena]|nr:hypothetical protein [Catalinimonas alkaloidigena]